MLNITEAHKNFIKKLESDGKSESTVIAYSKDIEQLIDHAVSMGASTVEELSIEHTQSFMEKLANKEYTAKSISRKTNAARTFIKYLYDEKLIEKDFSTELKHPKLKVNAPRILSKLEYRALRDAAKTDSRSYAMIEVLLQTGVTISELAGIKLENLDIQIDRGTLFIKKRNNKEARSVPLNKAVIDAINSYVENDRPKMDKSEHLFITKTGNGLLVRNIRSTINRYFKLAGVEKAKVNDLRHTFVAHHLMNGVSILHLSKIAGHKRISTTERYLQYIEVEEKTNKTELSVL